MLRLAAIAASVVNSVPEPTVEQMDDLVAFEVARRVSPPGGDPAELLAAVAPRRGVQRLLDLSLRGGPFGGQGLTLTSLEEAPAGIDFGPLTARLPEVLRTPSGRIEILPEPILGEIERLDSALPKVTTPDLALVGRRQLRTNNSWLRTLPRLAGGSSRATLQVHPDDAARVGAADADVVLLRSATGAVEVVLEVSEAVRPGVVCLPHGWAESDAWADDATTGPNVNVLTPATGVDPLSGTAVLNAVPVTISPQ